MATFQDLTFRNLVSPLDIRIGVPVVPVEFSHQPTIPGREIEFK